MSIRCKHCESRVPEWDSRDECCFECYEEHERMVSCLVGEEEEQG